MSPEAEGVLRWYRTAKERPWEKRKNYIFSIHHPDGRIKKMSMVSLDDMDMQRSDEERAALIDAKVALVLEVSKEFDI